MNSRARGLRLHEGGCHLPGIVLHLQIVHTMNAEIQFEWNKANRRANIAKHGFNFAEVGPAFVDPYRVVYPVDGRELAESRWVLLGQIEWRVLYVVFTMRESRVRLISARIAHEKERAIYGR